MEHSGDQSESAVAAQVQIALNAERIKRLEDDVRVFRHDLTDLRTTVIKMHETAHDLKALVEDLNGFSDNERVHLKHLVSSAGITKTNKEQRKFNLQVAGFAAGATLCTGSALVLVNHILVALGH